MRCGHAARLLFSWRVLFFRSISRSCAELDTGRRSGEPVDSQIAIKAITKQLCEARGNPYDDSPVFQLIDDLPRWEIDHTKTDVFRKSVDYSKKYKDRLHAAVREGARPCRKSPSSRPRQSARSRNRYCRRFVSFAARCQGACRHDRVYHRMPLPLQRAKMMREQLGFALNREGRFAEAEKVSRGDRCSIRRAKAMDCWVALTRPLGQPRQEGPPEVRRSSLGRAIEAYLDGFEADWRDAYPGINAVTLWRCRRT